jgi:hypothetical protein
MTINQPEIEQRLLKLFEKDPGMLPRDELTQMIKLVQAGEPGVGLENYCTQLYEYEVKVSIDIIREIAQLGSAMGINARYWERLKTA